MASNQCRWGRTLGRVSEALSRPALRSAPVLAVLGVALTLSGQAFCQTPPAQPSTSAPPTPPPEESKLVEHLEGGGWLGYGVQVGGDEDSRPFGITLGIRGGAVLPNHLYLGLSLGVFAGQSSSFTYQGVRYTVSQWQSQVGVEGGYDLGLGPLTLRPFAALGVNHSKVSYSANYVFNSYQEDRTTSTDLYLSAGAMAHLQLTKRIYGGLDAHLNVVTTSPLGAALVIAASGGVYF